MELEEKLTPFGLEPLGLELGAERLMAEGSTKS
jgi:hypothetical protein